MDSIARASLARQELAKGKGVSALKERLVVLEASPLLKA